MARTVGPAPAWLDRLAGVAWRGLVVGAAVAVVVMVLVSLSAVILPVFLALLFATVLVPLSDWLRGRGLRPGMASGLAVLTLLVALLLVGWLTLRAIADQWSEISGLIDEAVTALKDDAADSGIDDQQAAAVADDLKEATSTVVHLLVTGAVHVLPVVAAGLTTIGLSLFVTFFYAKDGRGMWTSVVRSAGDSGPLVDRIGRRVWETIAGYMRGQTVIAAIDSSCIGLGALVLGVPNPGAVACSPSSAASSPTSGRCSPAGWGCCWRWPRAASAWGR